MATRRRVESALSQYVNQIGEDGKQAYEMVEMLMQENPGIFNAPTIEANSLTSHKMLVRTGLGNATWIRGGEGVLPTTSTSQQAVFNSGLCRAYCEFSEDLLRLAKSDRTILQNEEDGALQTLRHEVSRALFYGDENDNSREFNGFARYYEDLTGEAKGQMIDAGGTGNDLRDIFMIGWGKNTATLFHPPGAPAGLLRVPLMAETAVNSPRADDPTKFDGLRPVKRMRFDWYVGFIMADWRYGVRIYNIDKNKILDGTTNILELVLRGINKIKNKNKCKLNIYSDRETLELADLQTVQKMIGGLLEKKDIYGYGINTTLVQGVAWHYDDALDKDQVRLT